jgi:hypothetical protein
MNTIFQGFRYRTHLVYDSDSIYNRMFALPEFLSEIKEILLEY